MKQILNTSWGRNLVSAILAAVLFALLGLLVGTPPAVTIFAAAIFGALLILIVQIGQVIQILWASRRSPTDIGETMMTEVESPAGQQELKQMPFISLLTVAIVQELYQTLFKRNQPLWAFEFLGMGQGAFPPENYGWINRYLEWMLMVGLGVFTILSAVLFAFFVHTITSPNGLSAATLVCAGPAFIVGFLLTFPVGLFVTSVIRRMFILYAARTDEARIK